MNGTIKKLTSDRGFGFVRGEDGIDRVAAWHRRRRDPLDDPNGRRRTSDMVFGIG